jgi:hypothetical protein
MKTRDITPDFIQKNGAILTMAVAQQLVGKQISITFPVYHANIQSVMSFTIKGFESEWERAAREELSGYANKQEYWKSYMTPESIEELKNTILLLTEHDDNSYWHNVGIRCNLVRYFYSEPAFHGSDANRLVSYVEMNKKTKRFL